MSSSSGINNSTTNQRYRQPGQIYGAYAPNNYERNDLFTGLLNFGATLSARSSADQWLTAQDPDRAIAEPSRLTRTPATLHSPVRILVLGNVLARDMNPRSRQLIPESSPRFTPTVPEPSPRFTAQQNMAIPTDDESRLTKDEQETVLKKLKKEIYNPTPKKIIQRLSLYYRDNARNSSSEKSKPKDDDEKNCAICLEDFEPRQVVMLTPCSHMFHEECIVPWVKSHGQCPVCRFALCDRIRAGAVATNNNQANVITNDPFAGELMSVMRAMEEAVVWRNVRAQH